MIITANRASAILYRFIKSVHPGTYILPANVCPVVPLTFVKAGIPFEFVDIDRHTLCMDEMQVIQKLVSKEEFYAGVVFVRTYGFQYDTSNFFEKIKQIDPEVKIIDDKCLCFPEFEEIKKSVDLELFSTGYAKPVDLGFGGYAKINETIHIKQFEEVADPGAYDKLENQYKESFKNNEKIKKPVENWLDTKDIDIPQAEYIEKVKDELAKVKSHKQQINTIYKEKLESHNQLKSEFSNWRFNIITQKKDELLKSIFKSGLFASSHYQPVNLLFDEDHFPISERLFSSIINLFNDKYINKEKAEKLCDIINKNIS